MLIQLHLRNFRCFKDHSITFKPLTVVVGANNAGKSTLVEALRLLSLVISRYGAANFHDVPDWLDIPRTYRGITPSTDGIDWNKVSIFHNLGEPPAIITASFENGSSVEIYIGNEARLHAVIKGPDGKPVTTKGHTKDVALPSMSILPQISPLPREESILTPDYAKRVITSSWASLHFRNQLNLFPDCFEQFKSIAEGTWPELRIRPLEGQGELPGNQLALLIQDKDFVAEIAWMGHGLQMWLQTMWFLARSSGKHTVILDEPDVYMHADLQRKLIRMLRGRHPQTIVATHSVEIMAEVDPSEILIVDRKARKSHYATSTPAVQSVIDNLGGVHNLQLARLSTAGKCLLVEGKDIAYLKQIQAMLFPHSQEPFDAVPNMAIGGWGGWNYAVGTNMLLKNSVGDDVLTYCIFDSDYHTPAELDERQGDAIEKGVQLHIWSKKEIENYFLIPEAIHRLISKEVRDAKTPPDPELIEAKTDEIVCALKDATFDALATEFLASNRAAGLPDANSKARKRIDTAWVNTEGRKSIVSGKAVIKSLSAWSQRIYRVSLSPMKILREMQKGEIDPEIASVVRAIERAKPFSEFRG